MPDYRLEFPDFSPSSLPAIPPTWEDTSWHQDGCPSFCTPDRGRQVFVDYEEPSMREFPDGPRFHVLGDGGQELLSTDVWQEVLDFCQ
jgi:hypothetical protein